MVRNMCVCVPVTTVSEKGGYDFEKELAGVRGKVWNKEREC